MTTNTTNSLISKACLAPMKHALLGLAALTLTLSTAAPCLADQFTFGGTYGDVTTTTGPSNTPVWQLTSDLSGAGYAGLYIQPTTPPFQLSSLTQLSADYLMTNGTFGGGAPRFSIIDTTNNANNEIYAYWGTPQSNGTFTDPNFGGSSLVNTGNLADALSTDLRYQINGFGGSSENPNTYLTWAQVLALVGTVDVGFITIDLDGGFVSTQQMDTTNFTANDSTFQPSPAPSSAPEPATLTLASLAIASFIGCRWRQRRRLLTA
jgi:hypothetical protein